MNKANNRKNKIHKSDGKFRKKRPSARNGKPLVSRMKIYGNAGSQLVRDVNSIRRFINTEIHNTDAVGNAVASTNVAAFVLLNGLTTGDGNGNRTGQSVKGDGIDLKFTITGNAAAVPLLQRILVVRDKQPNAAAFAIGDLLNATTVTSSYTIGNQMRFSVLYDESFTLVPGSDSYCIIRTTRLPANFHTEYNTNNVGNIGDIVSNSIYLVHFSDQAALNSAINYYSRYWFIDN